MNERGSAFHQNTEWFGGGWINTFAHGHVSLGTILLDAGLTQREIEKIAATIEKRTDQRADTATSHRRS